jgi:nucleoid-associated protein YgaU
MQKDLKIGMALGLILVAVAMVLFSAKHGLNTKAQIQTSHYAEPGKMATPKYSQNTGASREVPKRTRSVINLSSSPSIETDADVETEQNVPGSAVHNKQAKLETQKFHIVRSGDTLSGIACEYYGSANKLQKILDANRDVIKDENKLRPGTKLIIPE